MRSIKLLITAFLICTFSPVLFAEQSDDAVAETPKIDEKAIQYTSAEVAVANNDYKKTCEILGPLVKENYPPAKTLLGLLYFKGKGVEADASKGLSMIMDAANQGYEPAKATAVALIGELASLGEPVAMYNAGYLCLKGWGGEQDPNTCVKSIEQAAEIGYVKAVKLLYSIYAKGKYGIAPNKDKANYWNNKLQE